MSQFDGMSIAQMEEQSNELDERIRNLKNLIDSNTLPEDEECDRREEYWHLVTRLDILQEAMAAKIYEAEADEKDWS